MFFVSSKHTNKQKETDSFRNCQNMPVSQLELFTVGPWGVDG